jgi:hypothetical protein
VLAVVANGIVIRLVLLSVVEGYNAADWPRLGDIANALISLLTGAGWTTRSWQTVRVGYVADEVRRAHESQEAGSRIP